MLKIRKQRIKGFVCAGIWSSMKEIGCTFHPMKYRHIRCKGNTICTVYQDGNCETLPGTADFVILSNRFEF